MRRLARVPLVVLVLASQAAAWNEPETFRGVPWGASEEVAKERIPSTCRASSGPTFGERICHFEFQVGDVPAKGFLWFRSGAFVGVTFRFDAKSFHSMQATFKERYGKPTHTEGSVNVRHLWEGSKVHISLQKYIENSNESRALIMTATEREEQSKVLGERRKKGAGDL